MATVTGYNLIVRSAQPREPGRWHNRVLKESSLGLAETYASLPSVAEVQIVEFDDESMGYPFDRFSAVWAVPLSYDVVGTL